MFVYRQDETFIINDFPLHPEYGIKINGEVAKNEEELKDYGFFIDKILPMPEDGNRYELCADFNSKKLFYRIKGAIAEGKEDGLQQRMMKLENDITILQNSLVEQQYNELMKGVK